MEWYPLIIYSECFHFSPSKFQPLSFFSIFFIRFISICFSRNINRCHGNHDYIKYKVVITQLPSSCEKVVTMAWLRRHYHIGDIGHSSSNRFFLLLQMSPRQMSRPGCTSSDSFEAKKPVKWILPGAKVHCLCFVGGVVQRSTRPDSPLSPPPPPSTHTYTSSRPRLRWSPVH